MRIVAGSFRGRRLTSPRGRATRPTRDKVREALFDLLGPVEGFRAADLFAGSGALGLEALSRGAKWLVLVDKADSALAAIRSNLKALGVVSQGGQAAGLVVKKDLARGLGFLAKWAPLDLILADPPYGQGWARRLISGLPAGILSCGGLLAIESEASDPPPADRPWRLVKQRRYGQSLITILTPEAT
ncbi:MAG: 16S rRNA (guanine(966)-N(2))-methyltransferase RsmD [Deltaproteobacteria bacterium]|nr:16S rRNA (guanine(966)-N(2))-methyltransferase RsmD [Deltaproteobacteria bacterium]